MQTIAPTSQPDTQAPPPERTLRLAINALSLAPGGGMTGLVGYLRAWQRVTPQMQITVYASRQNVIDNCEAARSDIKVVPYAYEQSPGRHFMHQMLTLGPALEQSDADVVMSTNMMVGRCKLPQLVHHRNLLRFLEDADKRMLRPMKIRPVEWVRDKAAAHALRHAEAQVFVSDFLLQSAKRYVPKMAGHCEVIHNGLPAHLVALSQTDQPINAWAGQPNIIAVTSPCQHKNNPALARTLARLIKEHPGVPWRLIVCGGDAERLPDLVEAAKQHGVSDRLDFKGHVNAQQLGELLQQSACLFFPTRIESFGNPPLEAMANGCAVVASNATAIPEVVGEAGILADPDDDATFANAIARIYREPDHRAELIRKGHERIRSFSWEQSAIGMHRVFCQLVGATNGNKAP